MTTKDIKDYLVKELPDFQFFTGEEADQPPENHQSIQLLRNAHQLILDVSKVTGKKKLNRLKDFIEMQWERVGK
jgi:hypothetical protein